MQGNSDTLTALQQLQGPESYLQCKLIMFQQSDIIIEQLAAARGGILIVF